MLEKNYSIENFEKGKQQNKETLCTLFNLDPKNHFLVLWAIIRRRFIATGINFGVIRKL
jgi:hypothetical protein